MSVNRDVSASHRMLAGLEYFHGKTLFLMSGRGLTADEFRDTVRGSRCWRKLLNALTVPTRERAEAGHTLSCALPTQGDPCR